MTSTSEASSWPPSTLTVDTATIVNECESIELSPGRGQDRQFVAVVEMAALLYQGDTTNARHLWRRSTGNGAVMTPPLLGDWWNVGKAMLEWNSQALWAALKHISTSHPLPLSQYAAEVAASYRQRLLLKGYPVTAKPMAPLLNYASPQELADSCQQHGYEMMPNGTCRKTKAETNNQPLASLANLMNNGVVDPQASIVQVVTFLESSIASSQSNGSVETASTTTSAAKG